MLSKPSAAMQLNIAKHAVTPVPTLNEFQQLWQTWDLVTRSMIPADDLLKKPINLRNCYLFYLGHIPAFLDIHVTQSGGYAPVSPGHFQKVFERGIDPDVENPEICHAHSEIPDTWPTTKEILAYQEAVRERTAALYKGAEIHSNERLSKALWLSFEHEAMHLETLLYMLLQSDKILPPPGPTPDFEALAEQARKTAVGNKWYKIPTRTVTVGLGEKIINDNVSHYGWDIEKPPQSFVVPGFEAQARALTNREYARYLEANAISKLPASWVVSANGSKNGFCSANGSSASNFPSSEAFLENKAVRTVYGHIPLVLALDWPVMASYDELAGCAKWMNGRIPTMEEARSIYSHVDEMTAKLNGDISAATIPAVNGHLSNDGVEETPPYKPFQTKQAGEERQRQDHDEVTMPTNPLFADLRACNVGFKNFHPVPITHNGGRLAGLADMGGVWEWTSSPLRPAKGYRPMEEYPGYSSDFLDEKHNVVLGGSWATHPRLAGRKSFINWYQRNYPYAWVGARLVRDL